jgi:hypothetical protein
MAANAVAGGSDTPVSCDWRRRQVSEILPAGRNVSLGALLKGTESVYRRTRKKSAVARFSDRKSRMRGCGHALAPEKNQNRDSGGRKIMMTSRPP